MSSSASVRTLAALATAVSLMSATAATVDLAGVKLTYSLELRGKTVQLNGAGIRHRATFKIYTAGLYLVSKAATPEDVLASHGPKRIAITILPDINAEELGRLFVRGVEDNSSRGDLSALIPGLMRVSQIFSEQKQLKKGDAFEIDWIPSIGTVITIKGVEQDDPIKEVAFYNAVLRIWLGSAPADGKLKEALLGRSDAASSSNQRQQ